jgi:hypothetical protein
LYGFGFDMANFWLRKPEKADPLDYLLGYLDRKIPDWVSQEYLIKLIPDLYQYREVRQTLDKLKAQSAREKLSERLGFATSTLPDNNNE